MRTEERLRLLLAAEPEVLAAVDEVLDGRALGPGPGPLLLGISEAAEVLGVSRGTFYRLMAAGRIEPVELLPGGRQRVRRIDVERLAARSSRTASAGGGGDKR